MKCEVLELVVAAAAAAAVLVVVVGVAVFVVAMFVELPAANGGTLVGVVGGVEYWCMYGCWRVCR